MGMSSPKTKAEARKRIADLQGDIARLRARTPVANQTKIAIANMRAEIAQLRAKIPDLP